MAKGGLYHRLSSGSEKAQELHADHAYIRSGRIAVERALDEALRIERMRGLTNFQMERLNAVINTVRKAS